MLDLVALDMPGGDAFVEALTAAWDRGDAVLPIDQRLPHSSKIDLVERFDATLVQTSDGATRPMPGRPVEPGDALIVATSGTTGEAKGVVLTHDAVTASAKITSAALQVDPGADQWLACLPVAHIGGLSVVTRALHTSTPLLVHERFDAASCEAAAGAGATLVSLVVTALGRVDATLFRSVLLGGSAIPVDRPHNTVATYGMTETGSGVVYEGYPLEGVELKIADDQVEVRSPTLFRGYRDGSSPITAEGWFRTGDAGALSEDGVLSVQGRMGDVIVTGAEKVWPVVVERELSRLSWVDEAAVVGRADNEWGQIVAAVIKPAANATLPTLEELRETLSDILPRYALPRSLELVAELPKTSTGKLRRPSGPGGPKSGEDL